MLPKHRDGPVPQLPRTFTSWPDSASSNWENPKTARRTHPTATVNDAWELGTTASHNVGGPMAQSDMQ
eukprot:10491387-Prorocentrum_lima.AAC.1